MKAEPTRRYKPYPAYRDSGVEWLGEIPAHWEVRRLRFASKCNPAPSEVRGLRGDTEVSFVPMEAVGEYGGLSLDETKQLADVNAGYTYFCDSDVIVAKITPCFENGKGALAAGLLNGIAFGTTELHVLRASERVDPSFLFYVTISDEFRRLGEAHMYGAGGQKRVSESFVRNFSPAFPPLVEQRAIAAFLDRETAKIDALVAKKERLIELLQEKRTALITRAVTKGLDPDVPMKDSGVEWLGEIPAHWEVKKWRYCCRVTEGQVAPGDERFRDRILIAPNHIESATGRILYTETADEQGAISGKYLVEPGDIIYSKIRPALNKVCVAGGYWLCSADMYPVAVTEQRLAAKFLLYFMLSQPFVRLMVDESMRVAMPKVNRENLAACPLIIPSPDEQRAIAAFLDRETAKIDALIAKIREAIERLQEYRTALISAAVTGKIDVREQMS
ncbi:MAG: restriction endonuclease subunit S [Acidobacteriota bacterium]